MNKITQNKWATVASLVLAVFFILQLLATPVLAAGTQGGNHCNCNTICKEGTAHAQCPACVANGTLCNTAQTHAMPTESTDGTGAAESAAPESLPQQGADTPPQEEPEEGPPGEGAGANDEEQSGDEAEQDVQSIPEPPQQAGAITGFADATDAPLHTHAFGARPSAEQLAAVLPKQLLVLLDGAQEFVPVDVRWQSEAYEADAGEEPTGTQAQADAAVLEYIFTPVFAQGYTLAAPAPALPYVVVKLLRLGQLAPPDIVVRQDDSGYTATFTPNLAALEEGVHTVAGYRWQVNYDAQKIADEDGWYDIEEATEETYVRKVAPKDYSYHFRLQLAIKQEAQEETVLTSAPAQIVIQRADTMAGTGLVTYYSLPPQDPLHQTFADAPEIVDEELNFGRVMLKPYTATGLANPYAGIDDNMEFLGWKNMDTGANEGDYYIDEYYSLPAAGAPARFVAVWGPKVYLNGQTGSDENPGTQSAPVRTLGRAYEVLARYEGGNENANINGLDVTSFNPATGEITVEDNAASRANRNTNFNGQIVLTGDLSYSDDNEGRYEYITYGDIKGLSGTSATYSDGVRTITITGIAGATGYADGDPVRFTGSGRAFVAQAKSYNSTTNAYYLLQKRANVYQAAGGEYTYGRLLQYTQGLRGHTSRAPLTPRNDGLVAITAQGGAKFIFEDFTRYAIDGPTIFKNIELNFKHPGMDVDGQSVGYIGGLAGVGHYLAIGEGVTVPGKTSVIGAVDSYRPNIYGGSIRYRYDARSFNGPGGNNLGDQGPASLPNTRLTVKSGGWAFAYAGSYGQEVGTSSATAGRGESNAAVINVYGGTITHIGGAGHEGGSFAHNTYVYVYGADSAITSIAGAGNGSNGGTRAGGSTNVLVAESMPANRRVATLYGGSTRNGPVAGDTNLVVKGGNFGEVYGGSGDVEIGGNASITITGGTVGKLVGGGKTGGVPGRVSIDIRGGRVTSNMYTSSAGSTIYVNDRTFYQNRTNDPAVAFGLQFATMDHSELNYLLPTGNTAAHSPALQALAGEAAYDDYHSTRTYTVNGVEYYYPHVFPHATGSGSAAAAAYNKVVNGYTHTVYTQYNPNPIYTVTRRTAQLSLATVGSTALRVSGGQIDGDVYGGGEVAVVENDVTIDISGGVINGNVYGGGNGSVVPTVEMHTEVDNFASLTGQTYDQRVKAATKTEQFKWAGEESFNFETGGYSTAGNTPIDYENKLVYSPYFKDMGSVRGNTTVTVGGTARVGGSVYGGGQAGNVFGTARVVVNGGQIDGNVSGGGYEGYIAEDTAVEIAGGTVRGITYGGGYNGNVYKNATVTITGGQTGDVFGGGHAGVLGTRTLVDENNPPPEDPADPYYEDREEYFDLFNYNNGHAEVNVLGGQVRGNIYAGAEGLTTKMLVYGVTTLNMQGGEVYQNLYGGSKRSNDGTGRPTPTRLQDHVTFVNLVGGTVRGNVFGGGYYGLTRGSVHVHVGLAAVTDYCDYYSGTGAANKPDWLVAAPLTVNGSVYAGGDWGDPTSVGSFDNPTITGMAHVYVAGTGYDTVSPTRPSSPIGGEPFMQIRGSLYGSGNSASASGDTRVTLTDYGKWQQGAATRTLPSLQRATQVELFNSHVQLTGMSDATSSSLTPLNSIKYIDHLQLVGKDGQGSTLVLDTASSEIANLYSFTEKTGTQVNTGTPAPYTNPLNRILIQKGTNLAVGKTYEEAGGPTFRFGPVSGYAYLETPADSKAYVYARQKWTGNETWTTPPGAVNQNDGGFVSPDAALNTYDMDGNPGGSQQIPYTNLTNYRYWHIGQGMSYRYGALVAIADEGGGTPADAVLSANASVTLPPPAQESKFLIKNVLIDGVNLQEWALDNAGAWVQSPGAAQTQAEAIAAMHANPDYAFGLLMRTDEGFEGTPGPGAIISPRTNAAYQNQPSDAHATGQLALPQLNFTLTYSNGITQTQEIGKVKIVVAAVNPDDTTQVYEEVTIELTIATQTRKMNANQYLDLFATPGGQYTARLTLPPGPGYTLELLDVATQAAPGTAGFSLVPSGDVPNTGTDATRYGITMHTSNNVDNSNGWANKNMMDPVELALWQGGPPPGANNTIGTMDGRYNASISFTLTNNRMMEMLGEAGTVTLRVKYGEENGQALTFNIVLNIIKQTPQIDATVPLNMTVSVDPVGNFTVPNKEQYKITSYTRASLMVSEIGLVQDAEATQLFSQPNAVGVSINTLPLVWGSTLPVPAGKVDVFNINPAPAGGSQTLELETDIELVADTQIYKPNGLKKLGTITFTLDFERQ